MKNGEKGGRGERKQREIRGIKGGKRKYEAKCANIIFQIIRGGKKRKKG